MIARHFPGAVFIFASFYLCSSQKVYFMILPVNSAKELKAAQKSERYFQNVTKIFQNQNKIAKSIDFSYLL